MAKAEVLTATQELVDALKGRFRQADIDEVYAMSGRDVNSAVDDGLKFSDHAWVGTWEGEPITVFGVRGLGLLGDEGTPWLLGTDRIRENGIRQAFVQLSAPYVQEMLRDFAYLENYVDARNTVSIRWLKRIGFTVDPPEPAGYLKMPFHRFWVRRQPNV